MKELKTRLSFIALVVCLIFTRGSDGFMRVIWLMCSCAWLIQYIADIIAEHKK
jgi:hypothetical protein